MRNRSVSISSTIHRQYAVAIGAAMFVVTLGIGLHAQSPTTTTASQSPGDPPQDDGAPSGDEASEATTGRHMFGIFPNYTTVEGATDITPITSRQKFRLARLNSFDPDVYPFVALVAGMTMDYGHGVPGYLKQYGASLADGTLGNFMTTGVVASLTHQDPRYFQRGTGNVFRRALYAASRSVITLSDAGTAQLNVSEIGGNALGASISNLYYPSRERTLSATATRWGMQVLLDTLSNEAKEFWPDIHRKFQHR
jgi:hypothetical protein